MTRKLFREEHQVFRQTLRRFLEKEAAPYIDQWERERWIPRSFWRNMGSRGFLCPWVEERYGGSGADFLYSVVIIEELERIASGLLGIPLHSDIVVPYLDSYGREELKERWLPGCVTGEIVTAVAMTEPGAGSDLAGIRTSATVEGDHYVINGQKTFISNGIHADVVVVACKTDPQAVPPHKGISLIAVEADTPGFHKGRKLDKVGLHSQDTAELIFEDCRVPKTHLLGEENKGFQYLMEKLQQERLVVALGAQTAAEEMLRMTREYVQTREAFGKPISRLQHVRFELAEMATEIELGRTFVDEVLRDHIQGKNVIQKVSMAKWWITEMAKRTAARCMQLHGGYGYMEEYPIARRFRDIAVTTIYAGTTEIMKEIIAKQMDV